MRLNVWHPSALDSAQTCPGYDRNVGKEASLEGQDISNHGLFVAGLAHAVAPSSELYLIRVLEDDGCGTLYQIMQGIRTFMDEMAPQPGDTLVGTILNLSFGLHKAPEEAGFGLPCGDIESFESLLREADRKGATIVAAAGNDSYLQDPSAPRAMELPAGYPFVVGVAASSRARMRGCFSNGDLIASLRNTAAPGGDGEEGEELGELLGEVLECAIPKCSAKNPDPCLISMVYRGNPGYAYWVGTSFAAPLVSGQRALLIERMGPQEVDAVCLSTDETLPDGIINWATVLGIDCPQN